MQQIADQSSMRETTASSPGATSSTNVTNQTSITRLDEDIITLNQLDPYARSRRGIFSKALRNIHLNFHDITIEAGESHDNISVKYIERALTKCDQDIIDAMIFTVWCPTISFCEVMYSPDRKSFFEYDYNNNIWKKINSPQILYKNMFKAFIHKCVKLAEQFSFHQNKEEHNAAFNELISKLKTQHNKKLLWQGIVNDVSKNIIFDPYHADNYHNGSSDVWCNIFPGFAARKVNFDPTDFRLKKLLNHIYVVWANRDQELYKYILSWIAQPIRDLSRTNIALVLIGKPGCGKSMIFEFLCEYVYGKYISGIYSDSEPILQRFNGELSDKLLVCMDETNSTDSKKFSTDFNKFKSKITGNFSKIERKGLEITTETNYNSFAICSNHEIPVKLEEGDRRYVVADCNPEYVGNVEYFRTLVADCFNQEVGDIFYSYFRSEEFLEYKVPLIPAYVTKAKESIIDYQKPQVINFFDDIFVNGGYSIPSEHIGLDKVTGIPYISSRQFFKIFKAWCSFTLSSFTYKEKGFCLALYKYDGIGQAGRKIINKLRVTCASIEKHHETCLIKVASSETIIPLSDYIKLLQD